MIYTIKYEEVVKFPFDIENWIEDNDWDKYCWETGTVAILKKINIELFFGVSIINIQWKTINYEEMKKIIAIVNYYEKD